MIKSWKIIVQNIVLKLKKMEIKLILLKNGTYLISQLQEMEMEPTAFLSNPMEVVETMGNVGLISYPKHTSQKDILLYSDMLATIVDPSKSLLAKYLEQLPDEEILQ